MRDLIHQGVIFIDAQDSMITALKMMREARISSIFATHKDKVVGIITERDIVHKFSLIDKEDKLDAKVASFMTRPVKFARLEHLELDINKMFFEEKLRHFPVSIGSDDISEVLGVMTLTDIARAYLKGARLLAQTSDLGQVGIVCEDKQQEAIYCRLFEALKFDVLCVNDLSELLAHAKQTSLPIILDIDQMDIEKAKKQLAIIRNYPGLFILLSSQEKLVAPLAKLLDSPNHYVSLKPLEIGYLTSLLDSVGS